MIFLGLLANNPIAPIVPNFLFSFINLIFLIPFWVKYVVTNSEK